VFEKGKREKGERVAKRGEREARGI